MLYEIITNLDDEDKYTLKADDLKIAIATTILLSNGEYDLKDKEGSVYETSFLSESEESSRKKLKKHFGDFEKFIDEHKKEIADCLDSVMNFGLNVRPVFDKAINSITDEKEKEKYRAEVYNNNRSSLNDIGSCAWEMAKKIWAGHLYQELKIKTKETTDNKGWVKQHLDPGCPAAAGRGNDLCSCWKS